MLRLVRTRLSVLCLVLSLATVGALAAKAAEIVVARNAPALERYAAKELQRYLYQISGESPTIVVTAAPETDVFVIGDRFSEQIRATQLELEHPGSQGYVLKRSGRMLVIAGTDPEGTLYGVYGLLQDHYGVGFLMSGDVMPETRGPLRLVDVDEVKTPRQAIRGFTNHWCYMQGAGTWSLEDWKHYIDQMARMRMNLLSIHNYVFEGYRENWLNWGECKQKNFNQNSDQGAFYHGCSWPLREYPGLSADLFDDYAFGSAASMHTGGLSNKDVWERCASTFQQIIAHAHKRGVKVALGTEFHQLKPDQQEAVCESILTWYPDLDALVYYRHEGTDAPPFVQSIYDVFRKRAPKMNHVLTGWGELSEANLKDVPDDVRAGPFTAYSDKFENGVRYGQRAYWAGPWLEEDNKGDMHYMPWSKDLAKTVESYQKRADNMSGLVALTWRLTDAIDPRIFYIAAAPWDSANKWVTSRGVYLEYARRCYGVENADVLADILDQNEALAQDPADCRIGGNLGGIAPTLNAEQIRKADAQLAVIDTCLERTSNRDRIERLNWLRNRILGAKLHNQLAENPGGIAEAWSRSYLHRTMDMSTLGQLVSNHQMVMQLHIMKIEEAKRAAQRIKYPSHVVARQYSSGVQLDWHNEEPGAAGFNIYCNKEKLNSEPLPATRSSYNYLTGDVSGTFQVSVLAADGEDSLQCTPVTVDTSTPRVVVISPPTSAVPGQPVDIEARVCCGWLPDEVTAQLQYRRMGTERWVLLPMQRRCRAVFGARIPLDSLLEESIEYQICASVGGKPVMYPATAAEYSAFITMETGKFTPPPCAPKSLTLDADAKTLRWQVAPDPVFWWRIYRSNNANFTPGRDSILTYVYKNTQAFADCEPDFEDRPLTGAFYYRITSMDCLGNESAPSEAVRVKYP